jgi:GDPmannose 4,6-dehydratase
MLVGITGQDGILLSKLLRKKRIDFFGVVTPQTSLTGKRILQREIPGCELLELTEFNKFEFSRIIHQEKPTGIYNFAAVSSVKASFDFPELTFKVNYQMFCDLLEAALEYDDNIRIFQSSSSEMFGNTDVEIQTESTPFSPVSPYGESKLLAHLEARKAREKGHFVNTGILFNHESEFRRQGFLTEKIVRFAAARSLGARETLVLGTLDVSRDWGYAGDFVRGIYSSMQFERPEEFILSTGVQRNILELVRTAMEIIGDNTKVDQIIEVSENLARSKEKFNSCGDFSKARDLYSWSPSTSFTEMLRIMISSKVNEIKNSEENS